MSDHLTVIVITGLILSEQWFVSARSFLRGRYRHALSATASSGTCRVATQDVVGGFVRQLIFLAWFTWVFASGQLDPTDVNVHWSKLVGGIAQGATVWALYVWLHWLSSRHPRSRKDFRDLVRSIGLLWPRSRTGQVLMRITLLLNPFTEEIAARGVMVVLVSKVSGSMPLALGIGLVSCLLTHIYQGLRALPGHTLYYLIAIGLTLGKWGLPAAIALHFCANQRLFLGNRMKWLRKLRAQSQRKVANSEITKAEDSQNPS